MRIHDIEIRNFRSLEHFQLSDIPDKGVIVISGDNEAGKSTVVEALQLLLNPKVKHDSNTAQLKSIQTLGLDAPIFVSMRATLGPVTFRITKQYKKKSFAVLSIEAPRRAEYKGREAEDQFRQLLAEHLDSSLASALLVPQGEVDPVINAAGIPTLGAALELLGGGEAHVDDTELMKAVEERYRLYYSLTGKPRAELERVQKELSQAEGQLAEAEAEVSRLEEDVTQFERETKRRDSAAADIPAAQQDLVSRRAEYEAARVQHLEIDKARAEVEAAEHQLAKAKSKLNERKKLQADLASQTERCEALSLELDKLRRAQEEHSKRIHEATKKEQEAKKTVDTLREQLQHARKILETTQAQTEKAALSQLIADLDARQEAVKKLQDRVPTTPIAAAQVKKLDDAVLAAKVAEAKVGAHAATVAFTANSPTTISVGEESIELGNYAISLTEETNIHMGNVTAVFTPAAGGKADRDALTRARELVSTILGRMGCETPEQAHAQFDAEQQLIREFDTARNERNLVLAGRDESTIRSHVDMLARKLAESETVDVDISDAQQKAQRLESEAADAESAFDLAKSALDAESKNDKEVELRVQETLLTAAEESRDALKDALSQVAETESELEEGVDKAQLGVAQAAEKLGELREHAPELGVVKALLEGAETRLESLKETVHTAEKNIELRRGKIIQAEGAAERLIRSREAAEAARYRNDQVQTQAAGIALLRETLLRHRDEARARYVEPFSKKLTHLASVLFGPQVEFELNDQLDIDQRVLDNKAVSLTDLSGGAREQLGILARFAVAELVAQEGGMPIFLDDALGYADTERLARMNVLLGFMGKQHQVFVLTCMPSRYAEVVGKRSFDMAELKAKA